MAHYAKIENGVVTDVIVADADVINTLSGVWLQTSYNTIGGEHILGGTPYRKNYAGEGYSYDEVRDAFIPPSPHPSWVLNDITCLWENPVPLPEDADTLSYTWNEATTSWDLV